MAAYVAFSSFAWGALRNTYLHNERPLFDTEYANLALTGQVKGEDGASREFFLVSGAHDKDFPWGDTECFWDVLLLVGDGSGGWRRYVGGASERQWQGRQGGKTDDRDLRSAFGFRYGGAVSRAGRTRRNLCRRR